MATFIWYSLPTILACGLVGDVPPPPPGVEPPAAKAKTGKALLLEQGIVAESADLLRYLRERTPPAEDVSRVAALVEQLGADSFAAREDASRRLVALESRAVEALRAASRSPDLEVKRRAAKCLQEIAARTPLPGTTLEVVRVLRARKDAAAVGPLLAYLPVAEDPVIVETTYYALLELTEEGVPAELLAALTDRRPERRAAAGCVVGRNGDAKQRTAVARLLADPDAEVRLRAAQGLLAGMDDRGVPALVRLLEAGSLEIAWQAEELLRFLAGEASPAAVVGTGTAAERRRCATAWDGWVNEKAKQYTAEKAIHAGRRPRLVMAVEDNQERHVITLESWMRKDAPWDAARRQRVGVRIWLCGWDGTARAEAMDVQQFAARYLRGKTSRYSFASRDQVAHHRFSVLGLFTNDWTGWDPVTNSFSARMANGHTLAAKDDRETSKEDDYPVSGMPPRLLELDRQGRTVWQAFFDHPTAGLVVCPLVRVGFEYPGKQAADQEGEASRVGRLKHANPAVRRLAALQLAEQYPSDAVFRAAVAALTDPDHQVIQSAIWLLHKRPLTPEAVRALVRCLDHQDIGVRSTASHRLGCSDSRVVGDLVTAIRNRTGSNASRRRSWAAYTLGWLTHRRDPRVHEEVKRALTDGDPEVRRWVVQALLQHMPSARSYIPDLMKTLKDPDREVARTAEHFWAGLKDLGVIAAPHFFAKVKEDPENALHAVGTLHALVPNDPRVFPLLLKYECVWWLPEYREPEQVRQTVRVLKRLLKKEESRREALLAIEKLGPLAKDLGPDLVGIALAEGKRNLYPKIFEIDVLEKVDSKLGRQVRADVRKMEIDRWGQFADPD